MDLGSLFGLLGTWLLIVWALVSGSSGNVGYYIDTPSIILVCGASSAVIFLVFPIGQARALIKVMKKAFFHRPRELDKLIEQARTTVDRDKCQDLWQQCHAVLHEDQPYTFMMNPMSVVFFDRRFKNVEVTKVGINPAWEYYVPKPDQLHSGN